MWLSFHSDLQPVFIVPVTSSMSEFEPALKGRKTVGPDSPLDVEAVLMGINFTHALIRAF